MVADRSVNMPPLDRRVEKQLARDADDRALADGEKSARQLQVENSHFGRLGARVDHSRARSRY